MTYTEFINEVKKVNEPRIFKIKNSYSIRGAYRWYCKNRPKKHKFVLEEGKFYKIIRAINNKLAEALIKGEEVKFPSRMGGLEIRRYKIEPYINEEGKLIYKAPVNWDATLKFWYESPEARENRIVIKVEKRDNFKIEYIKSKAVFKKKSFFSFQPNRSLRMRVHDAAEKGELDAFEYNSWKNGRI